MSRFDAAIFDLDGTLLDTERLALRAGYAVLTQMGQPHHPGILEDQIGKDGPTGARAIAAVYGRAFPIDDFIARWDQMFLTLLDQGIPLRPGVTDLLGQIAGLGLPRAVATSSGRASATKKLAQTGLAHHFATVVTFDCVTRPKPEPEAFLLAARRLGADPARCIAFEDSDIGSKAARAAGMLVVQVPDLAATTGPHAHHLAPDLLAGARMAGLI